MKWLVVITAPVLYVRTVALYIQYERYQSHTVLYVHTCVRTINKSLSHVHTYLRTLFAGHQIDAHPLASCSCLLDLVVGGEDLHCAKKNKAATDLARFVSANVGEHRGPVQL